MKLNYASLAKQLLKEQLQEWEQCKIGYASLDTVKIKTFQFDGFSVKVQFNAGRLISTSAKVDAKSIKERKCFLCPQNLPAEQRNVKYKDDYLILVNPFPIFPEHFTIPVKEHKPQEIKNSFNILINLSKDLEDEYVVFYNGPRCGASAPDHLHFQAGKKFFMTIDKEYIEIRNRFGKKINSADGISSFVIDDGLRKILSIESRNREMLIDYFAKVLNALEKVMSENQEPMFNIISFFEKNSWRIIIFLREKHRPHHYFEEGESKLMLSPASVDLGGVCITPREEDFEKITKENIIDIFKEVFINKTKLAEIKSAIEENFN